jgi:hypothetical protein
MKLTKEQLKQIIKEEIDNFNLEKDPEKEHDFGGLRDQTNSTDHEGVSTSFLPMKEESEEGEGYPPPHKMKKLVRQAKLNNRYEPSDKGQLKRDYDKHVRNTLRDPKHSQAHKRK